MDIILQTEQRKVLALSPLGPVLIKGVAGSGKSTVALFRAKYLIENFPNLFSEPNVIIFTFNRVLADQLDLLKFQVSGGYNLENGSIDDTVKKGIRVDVTNFHRWVMKFLRSYGYQEFNIIKNKEIKQFITSEIFSNRAWGLSSKNIDFLQEEISWIKGKVIKSFDQYMSVSRIGRGTNVRLTSEQRKSVWRLYVNYNKYLKNQKICDFDDFSLWALEIIENNPNFVPPYSHIIIDEAQDLNTAQLMVLKQLVQLETNSITIIADIAQRIYKSGFTWKDVELSFVGRTTVLKNNYRCTIPIALAAQSLLANDNTEKKYTDILSARQSNFKPQVYYCYSYDAEKSKCISLLNEVKSKYNNILLLHRTLSGVKVISKWLNEVNIEHIILHRTNHYEPSQIYVSTLSTIKGLEYDVVMILDCNSDLIPIALGSEKNEDDLHIATERRLLYTAMTRARDELYLFTSGKPSRFIKEIDIDLLDIFKI